MVVVFLTGYLLLANLMFTGITAKAGLQDSTVSIISERDAGTLIIKVVNLKPPFGTLRLALFGSRKTYTSKKNPVRSTAVEITSSNATIEFSGLKPNYYAIMLYHDANNNNKFDKFLGLPLEQYGFSNNARPGLGPPDFDRTKFQIRPGKKLFLKIRAR